MSRSSRQQGYFLIIAVIFILVMGMMGSLIAYLFANRAQLSVAQQSGLRAFYIAESGLEIGARLLTMPTLSSRIACGSITGTASITNATMGSGTFTMTTINSSPVFATNTLSSALTSTDTTISVNSTSGFVSAGRILIDQEAIDYAAISGNSFISMVRGTAGTQASSHANGASVSQYQCSLNVQSGIPNLTSPSYQRELQWNVELQDGWIVTDIAGSNFEFLRWNKPTEISWNAVSIAGGSSAANLNAVSMLSNADGWAVGKEAASSFSILHWNGSTWGLNALAGACNQQNLLGISVVSSQQGFAVGSRYRPACAVSGNFRYTILYWNGSSWSLLTPSTSPSIPADASTNQDLNAIHVIDTNGDGLTNIGFAVGNSGTIIQYNGTNWVAATSPVTNHLNGVFTVSASEAWAVGASGVILKWNGSSWSSVSSPVSSPLNAISMLDTNNDGLADVGWAVGSGEKILSYNGSTWSLVYSGSTALFGVAIINDQDAWAVGESGAARHWDGSSWTSVSSGTTQAINGISLIPQKQEPISAWRQVFH